jgi:hypothetical protein
MNVFEMREFGHVAPLAGRGRIVLTIRVRGFSANPRLTPVPLTPTLSPQAG